MLVFQGYHHIQTTFSEHFMHLTFECQIYTHSRRECQICQHKRQMFVDFTSKCQARTYFTF